MLHIRRDERQLVEHAGEVMNDRIAAEPTEYTDADQRAALHLDVMGKALTSQLVVSGAEYNEIDAMRLFRQIIEAELDAWVPGASQRLIARAGRALGKDIRIPRVEDCGAEPRWHAFVRDYVGGVPVMHCVTCDRLYRA